MDFLWRDGEAMPNCTNLHERPFRSDSHAQ